MEALPGLDYLFDPHKRIYWGFVLSSIVLAILYVAFSPGRSRLAFSKKAWFHPSARLDYGYYFLSVLIKAFIIIPLVISVESIAFYTRDIMAQILGYRFPLRWDYTTLMLVYTFSIFIVSDFTRYWLHRWLHTVPFLWQFHKVHHSARVLNPLTFYRVHPVENLLFGFRYAFSIGTVTGVFIYFFGARLSLYDILGVNAFVFLALILGSNLRHSHVHFRYPEWLEKWLISPAQHQLHHTIDLGHTNIGGVLAIWDRMFGTLHVSTGKERLSFGLPRTQRREFDSIPKLLISPFKLIFQRSLR